MELSFDGRQELRKATEKLLESVPEGKRIQLPKKTLEMLLFEKNEKHSDDIAYPFWSGDFLKKLDLSQISFKNISFSAADMDAVFKGFFTKNEFGYVINYSGTNAEINLDGSTVNGCDFSGTKITGKIINAFSCNFSNCQLTADNLKECNGYMGCNFYGNNLHGLNISYNYVIDNGNIYDDKLDVPSCFRDTGVSFSKESFKELFDVVKDIEYYGTRNKEKFIKEFCDEIMFNLEGCYVDGVLIKPKKEIQKTASEKKEEYEKMKQDIFASIENAVTEQNGKPRK